MAIAPDTKDWTWVLDRPCPQCGLEAGTVQGRYLPGLLRENAAAWVAVLARPDVGDRPDPDVWSPLEYACHVRDVHALFEGRLRSMLEQDDPAYADWDQDAAAVDGRYAEQSPGTVKQDLVAAAGRSAGRFEGVADDQWSRPGHCGDGTAFTVTTLSQYYAHDVVHHLWDVGG